MTAESRPPFDPRPVVLAGDLVRLEPLSAAHARDLYRAGRDAAVWRYADRAAFHDVDDVRGWIDEVARGAVAARQVPFAIVHRAEDRAIGSTRYGDIRRADRGLEIGWTWIGLRYQRTGVNTEGKLLLLRHAFETLGAHRVQLEMDSRNERSQRAVERLGARREGVLRRHMVLPDGFVRDTVMYSLVDLEWPRVRARLEELRRRQEPQSAH